MLTNARDYLPIGSVVLLKGGSKKVMIIGIMPSTPDNGRPMEDYDYVGVIYPEGFLDVQNMLLVSHKSISDVVFSGYSNKEREDFLGALDRNIRKMSETAGEEAGAE